MTYYWCSIVTIALSRAETMFFSIWPWSDLSRSPMVKLIMPFYLRHMTSYLCCIVTIALSRTETLFLSIWPRSELSRSPNVKLIVPSDQRLITSYWRSRVTIALSRFVHDIFAVKLLKTSPEIRYLTFSGSLTSTNSSFHLTICWPFPMRFIWDMLRWYPFYYLLCTFIFSAQILVILKRVLNSMGKFQKYSPTLGSHKFETLWPNVTIEGPLELH